MENKNHPNKETDSKWAFIPPHHSSEQRCLALLRKDETKYLLLVETYSEDSRDLFLGETYSSKGFKREPEFFNGTLYEMPEDEILKKEKTSGLFDLLISDRLENPPFIPKKLWRVEEVPAKYVSSLDEYMHENL